MDILSTKLGYQFREPLLLARALRHRSAGRENNERLEFLGDAVLGFIIADALFRQYPDAPEGELSRVRASLVQQGTLASIARDLKLGEHLSLGPGELKTGGSNRESILADALEAVICAIYLDAGMITCAEKVRQWFAPRMVDLKETTGKDPKTRLQEYMQAKRAPLPVYEIEEIIGKDHQQTFVVRCHIPMLGETLTGSGTSRKIAEQNAALAVLDKLAGGKHA